MTLPHQPALTSQAILDLHIDVPIYRIEDHGTYLRFYLYGGDVVDYRIPASAPRVPKPRQAG